MNPILDQMVAERQLSLLDVDTLRQTANGQLTEWKEPELLAWVAKQYEVPFTTLEDQVPDAGLLALFPVRLLLKYELLPLQREGEWIAVATCRLFATEGLDCLRTLTGLRLRPVLAPGDAIRREMKKRLGVGADTLDSLEEEAGLEVINEDSDDDDVNLDEAAQDASIIRFVNQILSDAIALRATDIHLEPFEDELRIRYRIDGVLQDIPMPVQIKRFQAAIVSRVKILSHLDIAEKRLPQDGRLKVRLEHFEVDIRVSLIPMLHGEAVVMRLLKKDSAMDGLSKLMMGPREEGLFRSVLGLPHGIVLVTGPTGSGKTTTLYAALNEINDSQRKIITIEDPIEYHIKGINQIQVSQKAGLTFARGLRAILRHDPDVVLIGEIRDTETAQIAVQASLTGHLVFSTLHTNDAPGALPRLIDMKVEPYLVASALELVLAQRLVRVLCPNCRVKDTTPAATTFKQEIGLEANIPIYRASSCEACRHTGYHGRHGIFELMTMNDQLRELILRSSSAGEIRDAARRGGLRSLSEDGWRLVAEGLTSADEVLRVSKDERVGTNGNGNGNSH